MSVCVYLVMTVTVRKMNYYSTSLETHGCVCVCVWGGVYARVCLAMCE